MTIKSRFLLKARLGKTLNQLIDCTIKETDSIYFMGICGVAMASLAIYLKQQGFNVFGSDKNIYPPMSEELKKQNIKVLPYNEENIKSSIKLVIVGNVIGKDHKEILRAKSLTVPCLSLPEFLEQTLLSETKNIVVSGTHGKSTISALMSCVGEKAMQEPSFFIGAIPRNFSRSFRYTQSPWFIIEGDEYDTSFFLKKPKFFYYNPFAVILTGIEFDHGDIYKDIEEIKQLFFELVKKIPASGWLVICTKNPFLKEIIKHCKGTVITYGVNEGDYTIKNRIVKKDRQDFDICHKGQAYHCSVDFFGEYNVLNALAVFALSHRLNWSIKDILKGLENFKGIKKRLEFKQEIKGAKIYEDFAHHPTAVQATVSALKEKYPNKKLITVFEPRSFTSRLKVFQKDYIQSFLNSDSIFITKSYDLSRILEENRFSCKQLVKDLKDKGKQAFYYEDFKDLEKELLRRFNKDTVVVFMTSGSLAGLIQKITNKEKGL